MNEAKFTVQFQFENAIPGTEVVIMRTTDVDVVDMHSHEFVEIAYVQDGSGWHVLGDQIQRCGPGCLYVIDYGEAHMFMAEQGTMTVCNLIFLPNFLGMFSSGEQSLFRVIRHSLLRGFAYDELSRSMSAKFDGEQQGVISGLFDRMLSEYTG